VNDTSGKKTTCPLAKKKGTPASPATALANIVLPVPGLPVRRTPLDGRPPREANADGSLKNWTTSCNSCNADQRCASEREVVKTDLFGFISPVNIAEFDPIDFPGFEFLSLRTHFHDSRILKQNGQNSNGHCRTRSCSLDERLRYLETYRIALHPPSPEISRPLKTWRTPLRARDQMDVERESSPNITITYAH
jgi:hypothetical protein